MQIIESSGFQRARTETFFLWGHFDLSLCFDGWKGTPDALESFNRETFTSPPERIQFAIESVTLRIRLVEPANVDFPLCSQYKIKSLA